MKDIKQISEWKTLRTYYHRHADGTVEVAIWDSRTDEPVWVETFPNMATARAVAEQERLDIAAYRRERKGKATWNY
jgi:hypothetical protein